MNLTKDQLEKLKLAVSSYEKWVRKEEEIRKEGQQLLTTVKNVCGSTGSNWTLVKADVDQIYAQAFREML